MSNPWPEEATVCFRDDIEPLVTIDLPREPVSQGAHGRKRRGLIAELQLLTGQVPWMYTGDVSVTIEWTTHLRWRYESDRAVDVDNIVKPILDGITGPNGVLIDDTQVNHVSVNWTTWNRTDRQHLKIELRSLDPDLYEPRGFAMVEVCPSLCLALPAFMNDPEARSAFWNVISSHFETYDELQRSGAGWELARTVLPLHRLFHRNKVTRFPLLTPGEYLSMRPDTLEAVGKSDN